MQTVIVPRERTQPWRWFRRSGFVVLVVSFAIALGLAQLWFHLEVRPGRVAAAVAAVASLVALLVFAVIVMLVPGRLRRLLRDVRYRWLTRGVDRAMRR
jgi:hypothetical protein